MSEQKNQGGQPPGEGNQPDRGQQKPEELLAEKRGLKKPDQAKPDEEKEGVVPEDEAWQGEGLGS